MEKVLNNLNVKELSGPKGLVVFFYPRAKAGPCSLEVARYNQELPEFQKMGYNVVGISNDVAKSNDEFSCDQGLNYPLISDVDKTISNHFKVIGNPVLSGKQYKDMIIRSTFVLDENGNTIIEMRDVEATKHIQDLKTELEERK